MAARGLSYEFVEAVDGRALSPEQHAQIDYPTAERRLKRPLTVGEAACALSHLLIYRKMVVEDIPRAVVLEDDAILEESFVEVLEQVARLDEEIVLLNHCHSRTYFWSLVRAPRIGSFRLVPFSSTPSGALAYYLTLSAARTLLRHGAPVSYVADWPLPIDVALRAKGIYPCVVRHDPSLSSEVGARPKTSPTKLLGYLGALTLVPFLLRRGRYTSFPDYVAREILSFRLCGPPP
jgi:glycosyl transferase family 25